MASENIGAPVGRTKCFIWTDEETALLLKVVADYKIKKLEDAQDWEAVRAKYEEICKRFTAAYPCEGDSEEFPRSYNEFTKDRIASKIKKMKAGFRRALDSGRKSGGGKTVATLYEECSEIWCGSPAAESIRYGIDAAEISETEISTMDGNDTEEPEEIPTPGTSASSQQETPETDGGDDFLELLGKKVRQRREELSSLLSSRRNAKSTRKVAFQEQMLSFVKEDARMKREDLELKKQMLIQYETSQEQFDKTMLNLSNTISRTISEGFTFMQSMLQPTIPQYQSQFHGNNTCIPNQQGMMYNQWSQFQNSSTCSNNESSSFTDMIKQ